MRQGGFSLIQMILSLVILSVLGASVGYGLTGGALAFSKNTDVLQTLGKLRFASERMVREVREIRRESAIPSNLDISVMTATMLRFTRGNGMEVTLRANAPLLTLAYAVPFGTWTLTDEVSSMTFTYVQSDGSTPATSKADVAFVEFDLVLMRDGVLYPQQTRVALRNRM